MHISVLTHNYPRFPGDFSGTFVEALCQEFVQQQQQITLLAPYDPAYDRPLDRASGAAIDFQLYRYAWPDHLHRLGYMRSMQSDLALRFNNYLLSPALFANGIATAMRHAMRERPDILHAHWLLPNGFIGAVVSRRLGIPLVVSVPGSDARVAAQNALFRSMARFTFRQASLLTANSVELRDNVVALGADKDKFDLILYGTDPNELKPNDTGVQALRQKLQIPDETVILLCVGRMVPKKGFDTMLQAMSRSDLRSKPIVTIMVGEGDEMVAWQAFAQDQGIQEKLRWVGSVPKGEIGRYYNLSDILVMPAASRPATGLAVCVLDAMSCGKPVVGSDVAGNPLAIVNGETGLIVPEQNPEALAQALIKLIDHEAMRHEMGKAGRIRIENQLGWPHLTRRYINHFERLVGM